MAKQQFCICTTSAGRTSCQFACDVLEQRLVRQRVARPLVKADRSDPWEPQAVIRPELLGPDQAHVPLDLGAGAQTPSSNLSERG